MNWFTPDRVAAIKALAALTGLVVAAMNVARLKTQKQSTDQIEKAIQDVRQSIRRSSAWICLAIIVLALAVLASD